jgi:hypothetical protein
VCTPRTLERFQTTSPNNSIHGAIIREQTAGLEPAVLLLASTTFILRQPKKVWGRISMGRGAWCAMLALFPLAVVAADDTSPAKSPIGVSWVETRDLKLYYYEPLGYLVPHAVRTFTNSLAWQRKMFGWTPSEQVVVYLQDRSDYGNASAPPAPHSALLFDVAPLQLAFETWTSSERMYALMNHELVHVVQADIASDEDRRWRQFFQGKIFPSPAFPETIFYSYLTIPRFNVPRWQAEGSAVFVETWMSGGLGRAQGGYDEMVFRAMVRDQAQFYDPLGLVSRGVKVDFQNMSNAYLYGTRFFHVARLHVLAREGARVDSARRREQTLLRRPVRARIRQASRAGMEGMDQLRAGFPATQPDGAAQVPGHAL